MMFTDSRDVLSERFACLWIATMGHSAMHFLGPAYLNLFSSPLKPYQGRELHHYASCAVFAFHHAGVPCMCPGCVWASSRNSCILRRPQMLLNHLHWRQGRAILCRLRACREICSSASR